MDRWLMVPIIGEAEELWTVNKSPQGPRLKGAEGGGARTGGTDGRVCVSACVFRGRGVTSCHTAGKSAPVSHICPWAQGQCLRAPGSKGKVSPCRHSDHISSLVNKWAAISVTNTANSVPLSPDCSVRAVTL